MFAKNFSDKYANIADISLNLNEDDLRLASD